jgi:hypothetical protein
VYKINYKAVVLAFVLQVLAGAIWYASTPFKLLGRPVWEDVSAQPSVSVMLLFALSCFACLFFTAWILARVKGMSGSERFFLVIGMWLFVALPNHFFVSLHLDLSDVDVWYLLSYGVVNSVIAAIILPLWRPSRSIFKN